MSRELDIIYMTKHPDTANQASDRPAFDEPFHDFSAFEKARAVAWRGPIKAWSKLSPEQRRERFNDARGVLMKLFK